MLLLMAVPVLSSLLVVIRIFLSWALVVEIEGRWPWQSQGAGWGIDMTGKGVHHYV